jgi:hypothetical protein
MMNQRSAADRDAANRHRRRQYAAEAATYDRDADRSDRWLLGTDHRQWACSRMPRLHWLQRLMELAPSRNQDELTCRPRRHVEAVGFTIEESDRLRAGVVERLVARKT